MKYSGIACLWFLLALSASSYRIKFGRQRNISRDMRSQEQANATGRMPAGHKLPAGQSEAEPPAGQVARYEIPDGLWGQKPPADEQGARQLRATMLGRLADGGYLVTPPVIRDSKNKIVRAHLKCSYFKHGRSESWTCDDPCILGLQFHINEDDDLPGKQLCYVASILYHKAHCHNGMPNHGKEFDGGHITQVAVTLCEVMGYGIQYLSDGARKACASTPKGTPLGEQNSLFLRQTGYFTSGMSFYMKRAGFFPFVKGLTLDETRQYYCEGARRAMTATVGAALSGACLAEHGAFLNNEQLVANWAKAIKTAGATGDCLEQHTLGRCFRGLLAKEKSKSSKNCAALTKTLGMMIHADEAEYSTVTKVLEVNPVDQDGCPHRSASVLVGATIGMFVRWTHNDHGFTIGPGVPVTSETPQFYCGLPKTAELGQRCLNSEMCKAGSCSNGVCCFSKNTDVKIKANERFCCSGKTSKWKDQFLCT